MFGIVENFVAALYAGTRGILSGFFIIPVVLSGSWGMMLLETAVFYSFVVHVFPVSDGFRNKLVELSPNKLSLPQNIRPFDGFDVLKASTTWQKANHDFARSRRLPPPEPPVFKAALAVDAAPHHGWLGRFSRSSWSPCSRRLSNDAPSPTMFLLPQNIRPFDGFDVLKASSTWQNRGQNRKKRSSRTRGTANSSQNRRNSSQNATSYAKECQGTRWEMGGVEGLRWGVPTSWQFPLFRVVYIHTTYKKPTMISRSS